MTKAVNLPDVYAIGVRPEGAYIGELGFTAAGNKPAVRIALWRASTGGGQIIYLPLIRR